MNLAPILDVAASIVSLTVAGAVPVVVPKLLSLMHITASAQQEASLENTITSSIGKAIAYGTKAGDPLLQNVTIKNSALGAAVAFAVDDAPEQLKALGYTPQSIAEVIDARITHAMTTKPTVVAAPAVAPSADALKTAAMLEKAVASVEASPMAVAAPA